MAKIPGAYLKGLFALKVCAIFCASSLSAASGELDGFRERVEEIRAKYRLPSLVCVVVNRKGETILDAFCGAADSRGKERVSAKTVFPVASITKTFAGTLAFLMVREGALKFDTKVRDLFPEKTGSWPKTLLDATLESCLTHTAGLPADTPELLALYSRASGPSLTSARLAILDGAATTILRGSRQSGFRYSNLGFLLAGSMMERAAGEPWESLLSRKILKPLGLDSAKFLSEIHSLGGDCAAPHRFVGEQPSPLPENPEGYFSACIGAAGSLFLSVGDLAKWAAWNLKDSPVRPRIFSDDELAEIHQPIAACPTSDAIPGTPRLTGYGRGWGSVESASGTLRFIGHSGTHGTDLEWMLLLPDHGLAFVFLTNAGGEPALQAFRELLEDLVRDIEKTNFSGIHRKNVNPAPPVFELSQTKPVASLRDLC